MKLHSRVVGFLAVLGLIVCELCFGTPVMAQERAHRTTPPQAYGSTEWPQSLRMADFILSLQNSAGATPDEPGAISVNQDSNMEYALIGLGAAYAATHTQKYLTGFENGIRWLAGREEMTDPTWKGSWYYVYSANSPYPHIPTSPGPGITDVRGVDATSSLFVYLLYLDQRLTGSPTLVQTYSANAQAALDFNISRNLDTDGFSWSSYQLFSSDNQWHLYQFKYAADQGDVYLGMQAGSLLYNSSRYGPIANFLKTQTPVVFFSTSQQRYGFGMDISGILDTSLDGYTEGFVQGYLAWMWETQHRIKRVWPGCDQKFEATGRS